MPTASASRCATPLPQYLGSTPSRPASVSIGCASGRVGSPANPILIPKRRPPQIPQAVLLLHDVHGLTCPQIAELLGNSPGSVKVRFHRARKRLLGALESGCAFSYDERGTFVCEPKG